METLQFLSDAQGRHTAVLIPIKEWDKMKKKYHIKDIKEAFQLSDLQKKILDSQEHLAISEFQDNDEFVAELKKDYGL